MRLRWKRYLGLFAALLFMLSFANSAFAVPAVPDKPLAVGASGADVRALQEALLELSYFKGDVTGIYDDNTAAALQRAQEALDLTADGIYNLKTANALNAYIDELNAAEAARSKPLSGYTIGIDPGHQEKADVKYEAIAPGSERTKERMSAGAVGVKTGTPEYELTLLVANKLKKRLENAGAAVIMTRTKSNVSLSNIDRAKLMNEKEVDFWVRLHCDFSTKSSDHGAHAITPAQSAAPDIYGQSLALSKDVLVQFCKTTGAKRNAVLIRDDQTGMNWSNAPVTTIEMGYLSNPAEDVQINRTSYQNSCAKGIYNGIVAYVGGLKAAEEEASSQ